MRSKNGARKCPDFFAIDSLNKVHLIECKGNQESAQNTIEQFIRGRQQKRNIKFMDESLVGQRLVTGLAIAGAGSDWESTLRIEDPPPEKAEYTVTAETTAPIVE